MPSATTEPASQSNQDSHLRRWRLHQEIAGRLLVVDVIVCAAFGLIALAGLLPGTGLAALLGASSGLLVGTAVALFAYCAIALSVARRPSGRGLRVVAEANLVFAAGAGVVAVAGQLTVLGVAVALGLVVVPLGTAALMFRAARH